MDLTIDKEDLINMICGTNPSYGIMNNETIKKTGRYNGSQGTWDWSKESLKELSEKTLLHLYFFIKNS